MCFRCLSSLYDPTCAKLNEMNRAASPHRELHTPRRTSAASSRAVSPRPLPSCRFFRSMRTPGRQTVASLFASRPLPLGPRLHGFAPLGRLEHSIAVSGPVVFAPSLGFVPLQGPRDLVDSFVSEARSLPIHAEAWGGGATVRGPVCLPGAGAVGRSRLHLPVLAEAGAVVKASVRGLRWPTLRLPKQS